MVLSAEAVAAVPPNAGAEEKFFALADLASPKDHHLGAESDVTPLRQPLARRHRARPTSAKGAVVDRQMGRRQAFAEPERGGNLRCATDAVDLFMPVLPMVWIDSRPFIPPPQRAATPAGLPELGNRTCGRAESTSPDANAPGQDATGGVCDGRPGIRAGKKRGGTPVFTSIPPRLKFCCGHRKSFFPAGNRREKDLFFDYFFTVPNRLPTASQSTTL